MKLTAFKYLLTLLVIFATALLAEAQTSQLETPLVESQVDKIPTYKGQHISLFKTWILTNFIKHQSMLPDEFTLKLIIERDGGVYHVETLEESPKLTLAIKKVFMNPPQFEPAIKNNKTVRYETSFVITKTTGIEGSLSGFTGLSVYNAESYIHNIGEINTLPRIAEGQPLADFLDLILGGGATNGVTSTSKDLKFNLVCYKDGSLKIAVVKSKPTSSIMKHLEKSLKRHSPIVAATSGGMAVSYVAPIHISAERLMQHRALSFAQEAKQKAAKGDTFNAHEVECLPSYNNCTILSYGNAIKAHIYAISPKLKRVNGEVVLEMEIGADGKVATSKVSSSTNKKLAKAVASAIPQISTQWSPAKIYGQSVKCKIDVKISFVKE